MIKADIIDEYFEKLDEYDCVITAQKIVDSLGSYDNIYEDREKFFLIQAPEAFRYGLLYDNFDGESSMTALCQFLPKNCKLMLNFDMKRNPKVTYKGDLEYISQIIASETADE